MTTQNPGSGGANDPASGEGDPKKDTVAYDTHRKLLEEKKRVQEEKRALEEKLQSLEAQKEAEERAKLEEQGNFKKLLEAERAEKKRLEEEHTGLKSTIINAQKQNAVLRFINGRVPTKYVDALLDVKGVAVNADGTVDLETAKLVAQEFEKEHGQLIDRDKQNGGLPSNSNLGGNPSTGKITYEQWQALPAAEMKKRIGEVDWSTAKQ
jgi:hypothetical protein